MLCVKCKKEIPDASVYCLFCGQKQSAPVRKPMRRANGLGTVYKLSGRRRRPWIARKNGQILGYYETKTEALRELNAFTGDSVADSYSFTFAEVYEHWSAEHFRDVTEDTAAQYASSFAAFAELHKRKYRELRTADYQAILDKYADMSESLVGKHKMLLTQLNKWAIREDIVSTDYASYCVARGRKAAGHEPMTDEEVERIYAAAERDETARIVCMLLSTGMRIGELFALRVADWHGTYVIGGEKTEAGRNRIVPIRQEGREHFAYFAEKATSETLLSGYSGNKRADLFRKRNYYKLLDELGIPRSKTPHSTRVTYTTIAVGENLPPEILQKILGHADFGTTQRFYAKPDADVLVQAVEKASKVATANVLLTNENSEKTN